MTGTTPTYRAVDAHERDEVLAQRGERGLGRHGERRAQLDRVRIVRLAEEEEERKK